MDSLTQFTLGAAVGAAVLGPRIGPRKAALTGGLLGTLPDLDVLFPFEDPIDAFTLHRGASHSFFVQALATPVFGEILLRLFEALRDNRLRCYLAVYLVFVSHAVIDALTVYGTRIFWPFFPEPVGAGSIFIIDPLYSLPLLLVVIWAFFRGSWSSRFARFLAAALIVSTAYLGWGLVAQQLVERRAQALLARAGIAPERLLATPTPFNTLLWKVIAIEGDHYLNLYLHLFAPRRTATAYAHPRGTRDLACLEDTPALAKLANFSDGFYRLGIVDGEVVVSDLRMGATPNYVFSFAVATLTEGRLLAMAPERRIRPRSAEGDIDWLIANLAGDPLTRPAEAAARVNLRHPLKVAQAGPKPTACS